MTKIIVTILLYVAALYPAFSQQQQQQHLSQDSTAELNVVIAKINAALFEAQATPGFPKLQAATVKLETVYDNTKGGGFKIFVKASRKWTKSSSNSITYKYKKTGNFKSTTSSRNEFVDIIKKAAEAYQSSASIAGLDKESFEVEVAFSMTVNTAGGIEFKLYGIELDGGGEWEKKVGHTITLEFH